MIAVIFEVSPAEGAHAHYLDIAASLRPTLDEIDGFISIERFESLSESGKIRSLSFWRVEAAIKYWRNLEAHRSAQELGREGALANYHLRIARVVRDYGFNERAEAPLNCRKWHDLSELQTQ